MNRRELGDILADNLLAGIDPFNKMLHDTGERYNGNPVFSFPLWLNGDWASLKVYRYTPTNAQYSLLAFLPEGATT